jgi:hypothetical protein
MGVRGFLRRVRFEGSVGGGDSGWSLAVQAPGVDVRGNPGGASGTIGTNPPAGPGINRNLVLGGIALLAVFFFVK